MDGIAVKEEAVSQRVNGNNGFLKMSNYPVLGSRVTLATSLLPRQQRRGCLPRPTRAKVSRTASSSS